MGKRIFLTSCSGFLLRNILPLFDKNDQVTVLYLAKDIEEGENFLDNLLIHLGVCNKSHANFRVIIGDLFKPLCGISDIVSIDSDYWLIGTLPFKFGKVDPTSVGSANNFVRNISQAILLYHNNVEKIKHCVFLSSAYNLDYENLILPEDLILGSSHFGNFDYCKKIIENQLFQTIISFDFPKSSIVRADVGLSAVSNQVGGIINVICEKLYTAGFEKLALLKDTKVNFTDVHRLNLAFKNILLTEPMETCNFFNAVDRYYSITMGDFIDIFNSISRRNIEILNVEYLADDLSYYDKIINKFFHQKLGFYLLYEFSNASVSTDKIEDKLGPVWMFSNRESKFEIVSKVISNSYMNNFKPNNMNLGPMPVY